MVNVTGNPKRKPVKYFNQATGKEDTRVQTQGEINLSKERLDAGTKAIGEREKEINKVKSQEPYLTDKQGRAKAARNLEDADPDFIQRNKIASKLSDEEYERTERLRIADQKDEFLNRKDANGNFVNKENKPAKEPSKIDKALKTGRDLLFGNMFESESSDAEVMALTFPGLSIGGAGTALASFDKLRAGGVSAETAAKITSNGGEITNVIKQTPSLMSVAKTIGTYAGVDVIVVWFQADNIATGTKIDVRQLKNDVSRGDRSPNDALSQAEGLRESFQSAKRDINIQTGLNPLLWTFREYFMSGLDSMELQIDEDIEFIKRKGI